MYNARKDTSLPLNLSGKVSPIIPKISCRVHCKYRFCLCCRTPSTLPTYTAFLRHGVCLDIPGHSNKHRSFSFLSSLTTVFGWPLFSWTLIFKIFVTHNFNDLLTFTRTFWKAHRYLSQGFGSSGTVFRIRIFRNQSRCTCARSCRWRHWKIIIVRKRLKSSWSS